MCDSGYLLHLSVGGGAENCDEHVCLSVYEHISRTTCAIFTEFLCMLPVAWLGPPLAALQYVMYFVTISEIHVLSIPIAFRILV